MNLKLAKTRIHIDLDMAGNPIQASVELHDPSGDVITLTTWVPAPFDSPGDVLLEALDEIQQRYGIQELLPYG